MSRPKRLVINARAVLDTLALPVDRFVRSSAPAQNGDWTCPNCGASVFASKDRCFACQRAKPAGGDAAGGMMGGMMGAVGDARVCMGAIEADGTGYGMQPRARRRQGKGPRKKSSRGCGFGSGRRRRARSLEVPCRGSRDAHRQGRRR